MWVVAREVAQSPPWERSRVSRCDLFGDQGLGGLAPACCAGPHGPPSRARAACVVVAKSPAGLDAKILVPQSDELKTKRLKVAL